MNLHIPIGTDPGPFPFSLTEPGVEHILKQIQLLPKDGSAAVTFEIDSNGGDTISTLRLISLLRNVDTTAIIHSAHSSAALLAVGCKRRLIRPKAKMLLHGTRTTVVVTALGPAGELPASTRRKALGLKKAMTHLLLARTKLTEAEILKIMSSASCIYRAEDAVRCGLADEIVSDEGGAQSTHQSQPSSVRRANLEFYEALETEAASLNPNIRVTDDFDSYLASNIEKRLKLLRQNGNTTVRFQFENTMDGLTDTSRRKAVVLAFRIISLLRHFNATAIIQTAVSSGALLAIACNRRLIRSDGMLVLHATMLDFPSAVIGSDGKAPEGEFRQGLSAQRAAESFLRRRTRLKDSDLRSCMAPGCTGQVSARTAIELGMADEVIDGVEKPEQGSAGEPKVRINGE